MAGFFESMKRMIEGKPVFDANDDSKGWAGADGREREAAADPQIAQQQGQPQPQQPAHVMDAGIQKGNPSTFPAVYIKRTRTTQSGSNQTVYVSIYNSSKLPIEIEEFEIMGRSQHYNYDLRPGQEREVMAYNGPRSRSEGNHEARLTYKTDEGKDYFQSIHDVEYQFEQHDQTYSIEEVRLRMPIRDIYG
jgi:hypothetical protein